MEKIILLLFLSLTEFIAISQEKVDSVTNCCTNDALPGKDEDGRPASFQGGYLVYQRWLQKQLNTKEKILNENHLQGKCLFRFLIDTTGRITDLQFCSMKGTLGETIIRDIYAQSPLWEPAISTKRGKVSQWYCQSINFQFGQSVD